MKQEILYSISNNGKSLPIMFDSLSSCYIQNSEFRPNGWALYQILFVLEGKGELFAKTKKYDLTSDCAFFTSPWLPHSYININNLKTAFMTFIGDFMTDILDYYDNDGFIFLQNVNVKKYIHRLDFIKNEFSDRKRDSLISSETYSFITSFFEDAYGVEPSPFKKISSYIEQNFTRAITLQELANEYNYSVSKLCKDFKKEMGCTIFEYILNLRLLYAHRALILNQNIRIKDIARDAGFSDECYFCRAYKKKYGCPPSQTQNSHISYDLSRFENLLKNP